MGDYMTEQETMKIPEEIILNGFPIKTDYDNTLLADRTEYGEYCTRRMTIVQDSNLSPYRSALNYCHELTEAMCDINHLDLKEHEKQVVGITIYQILMQHKKFFCRKDEV